jgi:hypothetical protein
LLNGQGRDIHRGFEPVRAKGVDDLQSFLLAAAHANAHAHGERIQGLHLGRLGRRVSFLGSHV